MTERVSVEETVEYEVEPATPRLADHQPDCAIFDAHAVKGWTDPCDCDCGGHDQ